MKKIFFAAVLLLGFLPFAAAQTGTWSGTLDVQGFKLGIVFHLEEENPTLDVPDQGAKGIPVQVERSDAGKVTIQVPAILASYEGLFMGNQIVGTFSQNGAELPLTLKPGVQKLNRPQTPVGPFPYAQEEISFHSGDFVLNGTLVLPEGCSRQTTAVVMVSGSGTQNRDEEVFEHKPFAVIADALARAGIASLRYDDRGFDDPSVSELGVTTADSREDALAAVRVLRERFDKVGIVGHSEGGTIAMMLAADQQVDFIVSLAGMSVSATETLIWQTGRALAGAGVPQDAIQQYGELLEDAYAALNAGEPLPSAEGRDLPDALKQTYQNVQQQIQTPYLKHFISLDVRPILGKITCPVLALNGSKDQQVEPTANLAALRDGLAANPANRIEQIEGVNHFFQHCTTGQATEYRSIEETFAPEALAIVVEWIKAR
ncbi:MAG: alpha/beta hydrolase [Bacteroidales bacterium]|nr:alpha/beta hydrolase [Bacteroidales bacterium]